MSVNETAELMLNMTGSLRNAGLGMKESAAIINSIPDRGIFGAVSPEDMKQYASSLGNFVGEMTPSKIAGITMFMKGGGIPTSAGLREGAANMPQMLSQMYSQLRSQVGGTVPNEVIAEQFTKSMGLGGFQTLRATGIFNSMMDNLGKIDMEGFVDKLQKEGIRPLEENVSKGIESLQNMRDILKRIQTILENTLGPIGEVIGPLGRWATSAMNVGGGALGNIARATGVGALAGAPIAGVGALPGAITGATIQSGVEIYRAFSMPGRR